MASSKTKLGHQRLPTEASRLASREFRQIGSPFVFCHADDLYFLNTKLGNFDSVPVIGGASGVTLTVKPRALLVALEVPPVNSNVPNGQIH